ncbi:MAG: hypothetical protein J6N71_05640 [Muribaculaceae bacterium]|nr:hypothetical protein [Muribaculaceae bacterium]
MSDYDDAMNDYDWYQNTGENREYFEDDYPNNSRQQHPLYHRNKNTKKFDETDLDCLTFFLAVAVIVGAIIGLIIWLI